MKLFRNQKGLAPLIIIAAIFLILAAGVLIINFNNVPKDSTAIPVPLPTPMNTQSPSLAPKLPIKSYMDYTIPKGWKEEPGDPAFIDSYAFINSPGFVAQGGIDHPEGAQIFLQRSENFQSLEEKKMNTFPGWKDITYTKVAGLEALRFHSDYEGHGLIYTFIKDGYDYSITLRTLDLKTENKYLGVFDKFLQSIKFK